jgi:hypothetical protein
MPRINEEGFLVMEIGNPQLIDWFCDFRGVQYTIHELDPEENLLIYRPMNGKRPEEYLNL